VSLVHRELFKGYKKVILGNAPIVNHFDLMVGDTKEEKEEKLMMRKLNAFAWQSWRNGCLQHREAQKDLLEAPRMDPQSWPDGEPLCLSWKRGSFDYNQECTEHAFTGVNSK
jgi:hypothetical protein